jgi:hypothetical protein
MYLKYCAPSRGVARSGLALLFCSSLRVFRDEVSPPPALPPPPCDPASLFAPAMRWRDTAGQVTRSPLSLRPRRPHRPHSARRQEPPTRGRAAGARALNARARAGCEPQPARQLPRLRTGVGSPVLGAIPARLSALGAIPARPPFRPAPKLLLPLQRRGARAADRATPGSERRASSRARSRAPAPFPRTNRTSLVPPLVLSGHAASLTPYPVPPPLSFPAPRPLLEPESRERPAAPAASPHRSSTPPPEPCASLTLP